MKPAFFTPMRKITNYKDRFNGKQYLTLLTIMNLCLKQNQIVLFFANKRIHCIQSKHKKGFIKEEYKEPPGGLGGPEVSGPAHLMSPAHVARQVGQT